MSLPRLIYIYVQQIWIAKTVSVVDVEIIIIIDIEIFQYTLALVINNFFYSQNNTAT